MTVTARALEEDSRITPLNDDFLVGGVLAVPSRNRIGNGPHAQTVQPRVMELLCVLAAVPGRTLSRSELMFHVWDGVVVGTAAIDRTVCCLRRSLGDCARRPDFIETVRKRGIRLMAPVRLCREMRQRAEAAAAGPEFSLRMTGRQLLAHGSLPYGADGAAASGFRLVNHAVGD